MQSDTDASPSACTLEFLTSLAPEGIMAFHTVITTPEFCEPLIFISHRHTKCDMRDVMHCLQHIALSFAALEYGWTLPHRHRLLFAPTIVDVIQCLNDKILPITFPKCATVHVPVK